MEGKEVKIGLLALGIIVLFVTCWELSLRARGVTIAYDDGNELWAHHRARVYQPKNQATVFIGSSRIKYALDTETWKKQTGGNAPVLLAIEGNSPLPVLEDLAADKNFAGNLVIDVTEILFFSSEPMSSTQAVEHVAYFKKQSPSDKASFLIKSKLESKLVFLDRDNFTVDDFFARFSPANRKGVFALPNKWPMEFGRINFDRQNIMTERFLTDTVLQNKVTANWVFFNSINTEKPAEGAKLDSFLRVIKHSVDQIKNRGGDVIFVRTPSSGPFWEGEQVGFPREKYWEVLLSYTGCKGIHFKDYKETDHFVCPEWSHLSPQDAISYTKHFITALEEKGWSFNNRRPITSIH